MGRPAKLIDISPPISEAIAVFPGDVAYARNVSMAMEEGQHLTLSSIQTTLHLGAHADAPNHYDGAGQGILERDLSLYYGTVQVIHALGTKGQRLLPEVLGAPIKAPRVLFRTDTFLDPNTWQDDFATLSPALVNVLAAQGVRLVGIDTPSIDPATAKDLVSHHAVASHDMAILEGLWLQDVAEGLYTLCAFPLALAGADASPVRAVLVDGF